MTNRISLISRRAFVKGSALLAVAASTGGLLSACAADEPAAPTFSEPTAEGGSEVAEAPEPSASAPESGSAPEPASEAAEVQQEAAAAAPVLV